MHNHFMKASVPREKFWAVVTVGGAAVAAFSYILWGPDGKSRSSKREERTVAGLENLGNTCYLNTILQSLAACPSFVNWLQRALRSGCFKDNRRELAYKLSKTLEVVNDYSSSHTGKEIYAPHDVLRALNNCNWKDGRDQQDCQELFQFLLTVLSEDIGETPSPLYLSDATKLVERKNGVVQPSLRSSIDAELPHTSCRGLDPPFRGLVANHLTCTACGHKNPVTYTQFDCLNLPIPYGSFFGTTSLDQMLEKFIQVEFVSDVNCTECAQKLQQEVMSSSNNSSPAFPESVTHTAKRKKLKKANLQEEAESKLMCKRIFEKQMTIAKLPQCLCIHVQRVAWTSTGEPTRRDEHVMFHEILDMSPYKQVIGSRDNLRGKSVHLYNNRPKRIRRDPSDDRYKSVNFIGSSFTRRRHPVQFLSHMQHHCLPKNHVIEEEIEQSSNKKFQDSRYHLTSAVVHVGDAKYGHFLTYRRAPSIFGEPLSNNWLCVSDENVTTAHISHIRMQRAYMLYYQRL